MRNRRVFFRFHKYTHTMQNDNNDILKIKQEFESLVSSVFQKDNTGKRIDELEMMMFKALQGIGKQLLNLHIENEKKTEPK